VVFVLVLLSGALLAQESEQAPKVTGADELVREKSSQWAGVWVHPDAEIADYDNLYLWQSVFQFRDVSDSNTNQTTIALSRGTQDSFAISEDSRAKFEEIVTDVVVKELNRSKQFTIVDAIQPRTLAVRGLVLDIVSNVPPNINRPGSVHLASVGEASFYFELIDAETGVIQARVGDRRLIQPPSGLNQVSQIPTTEATVWNDVSLWAQDQAMTLRRELDKLAKKSKKK
jgi:hypothetical protein